MTSGELSDRVAIWHVCWQAAVGRAPFIEPPLDVRIRARLLDAHRRPDRMLVAYLLLPTEIHVVAGLAPGEDAGDLARGVGNIVARWVRETHAVRSPVFGGPYRAQRILSADAVRSELRLLAWRPVFQGLCSTPSHYRHGAFRVALGLTPADGHDARPLLSLFGDAVQPARAGLRAMLARRPPTGECRQWELARGLALATGTVGPGPVMAREVRGAAAALVAAAGPDGIDGALRLLEVWVKAKLGLPVQVDLRAATDSAGARGRALVACLAVDHQLCSAASVARHFGRAKATLSEQMKACRVRAAVQQVLRTPVNRIVEEALALASMAV